ncbi:MAG: hypothetical protein AAGC60_28385 [Acidobacteriota bacterium]
MDTSDATVTVYIRNFLTEEIVFNRVEWISTGSGLKPPIQTEPSIGTQIPPNEALGVIVSATGDPDAPPISAFLLGVENGARCKFTAATQGNNLILIGGTTSAVATSTSEISGSAIIRESGAQCCEFSCVPAPPDDLCGS